MTVLADGLLVLADQREGPHAGGRVCLSRRVRGVKYGPNGLDFYLRQPDVATNGGCCSRCAAQRVRVYQRLSSRPGCRPGWTSC